MKPDQYQTEATATKSPHFYTDNHAPWELLIALRDAQISAEIIDQLKKSLFYNKPVDEDVIKMAMSGGLAGNYNADFPTGQSTIDLLHAILGIISEGGELSEHLEAIMNGEKVDIADLKEEFGDVLWYLAIAFNALHLNFEEVMKANNAKLRERFPNEFNHQDAVNRDKIAEKKAMAAS